MFEVSVRKDYQYLFTPINETLSAKITPIPTSNLSRPRNMSNPFIANAGKILSDNTKKRVEPNPRDSLIHSSGIHPVLQNHISVLQPIPQSPKISKPEPSEKKIIGLRNIGNSCYVNSILQCLIDLSPFKEAVLSLHQIDLNTSSKLNGRLALSFKRFLEKVKKSDTGSVLDPSEIQKTLGSVYPQFNGFEQQDSGEFLRCFFEAFSLEVNRVIRKIPYQEMTGSTAENIQIVADRWWNYSISRESSIITDSFQGQQVSIITCKNCEFGSISCETFLSLHLNLTEKRTSVDDLLKVHFSEIVHSSYQCSNCRKLKSCKQKSYFYRFPKVLIIQLKRFQVVSSVKTRLNTEVFISETLELNKFKHEAVKNSGSYLLKAISHHLGNLQFGHYTSECKVDRWYRFDDQKYNPITLPSSSNTAYLLFYTLIDN